MRLENLISASHTFTIGGKTYFVNDMLAKFGKKETNDIPITNFSKQMNINLWFKEKPSVMEIVEHTERINDAELKYPIFVSEDKKYIYDGMHRTCKMFIQKGKRATMKCIVITDEELSTIRHNIVPKK